MITLEERTAILVTGNQSQSFLQGQLTCHVAAMQVGEWAFFGYCNHKGRVLASGYLHYESLDCWIMVIATDLTPTVIPRLQRSAILSGVKVSLNEAIHVLGSQKATQQSIQLAETGYYLCLTKQAPTTAHSLQSTAWYLAELQAQLPIIQTSTSGLYTPHMLNLPNITLQRISAVSFDQGCYVGQEVVSRIHHKGRHKKQWQLIQSSDRIQLKITQTIYAADQAIGTITQTIPTGTTWHAAMLPIERVSQPMHVMLTDHSPIPIRHAN